ncbi:MAG: hypothetical protein KBD78_03955 [Oligoflexales bacterium]|nr:hypothetical protein [Oligoflexales bacterium]
MPAYAVIKRGPDLGGGRRRFTVILRADDGYSETQTILGDVSVLRAAARHFHQQRVAAVTPEVIDAAPPEFIAVTPS